MFGVDEVRKGEKVIEVFGGAPPAAPPSSYDASFHHLHFLANHGNKKKDSHRFEPL